MRTLLKYVLPVLFAALLSGCGASLVRKVRIGEEVAVRQYGTVGLDLTFEVENASAARCGSRRPNWNFSPERVRWDVPC